ncbi:MAG: right-handed parallel beta-helix repeat-containing protein, partial [Candidatus Hodarchaeales archaeon]
MFSWKNSRLNIFNRSIIGHNSKFEKNILKGGTKDLLTILLVLMMTISVLTLVGTQTNTNSNTNSENNNFNYSSYGVSPINLPKFNPESLIPPIYTSSVSTNSPVVQIKNNEDFSKLNIPGGGTASNPYIIENLQLIDPTNTLLLIESTTAHVIVRNNNLDGNLLSPLAYQYGIYIKNAQNVIIQDNIITGVNYGIVIDEDSSFNLITNNLIKFVEYGVTIFGESRNNEIFSNIFEDISYSAIHM